MEGIFTVFEASKYCNVSPKTIINWIDAGHIEAYRTVGGHRRIKRDDLETFMRKQGIPIPEEAPVMERKRILIVDDDPIIVETLVQALEEDEHDYEIISASDGFRGGPPGESLQAPPAHFGYHDAGHQGIRGVQEDQVG